MKFGRGAGRNSQSRSLLPGSAPPPAYLFPSPQLQYLSVVKIITYGQIEDNHKLPWVAENVTGGEIVCHIILYFYPFSPIDAVFNAPSSFYASGPLLFFLLLCSYKPKILVISSAAISRLLFFPAFLSMLSIFCSMDLRINSRPSMSLSSKKSMGF